METCVSKQLTSFNIVYATLSHVMSAHNDFCPSRNAIHPFVQHTHSLVTSSPSQFSEQLSWFHGICNRVQY